MVFELYEVNLDNPSPQERQYTRIAFDREEIIGRTLPAHVQLMSSKWQAEFYMTDFQSVCGEPNGLHFCSIGYGSYESADSSSIPGCGGELEDCSFWWAADPTVFPIRVNP